jgi:AcrR family transcriptional regulator
LGYHQSVETGNQRLSGPQARTRAAILEATASVLARDRTATLPDIATAAGVSLTTVHRYFADRSRLMYEATADAMRAVADAVDGAATDRGPAIDAMRRTVTALTALGDRIMFLFGDPGLLDNVMLEGQLNDDPIIELIERGQREGIFVTELSAEWIEHVLFALILQGCQDAATGKLPRHTVAPIVIQTFERGLRSPS